VGHEQLSCPEALFQPKQQQQQQQQKEKTMDVTSL